MLRSLTSGLGKQFVPNPWHKDFITLISSSISRRCFKISQVGQSSRQRHPRGVTCLTSSNVRYLGVDHKVHYNQTSGCGKQFINFYHRNNGYKQADFFRCTYRIGYQLQNFTNTNTSQNHHYVVLPNGLRFFPLNNNEDLSFTSWFVLTLDFQSIRLEI